MRNILLISLAISSLFALSTAGPYGRYGYNLVIHHPSSHGYGYGGKSVRYDHRYHVPHHHTKEITYDHHDHHDHTDHHDDHDDHDHHGYEFDNDGQEFGQQNFQFDDDFGYP